MSKIGTNRVNLNLNSHTMSINKLSSRVLFVEKLSLCSIDKQLIFLIQFLFSLCEFSMVVFFFSQINIYTDYVELNIWIETKRIIRSIWTPNECSPQYSFYVITTEFCSFKFLWSNKDQISSLSLCPRVRILSQHLRCTQPYKNLSKFSW